MKELKVFNHKEFGELEILIIDGKEYFPATDCAEILGYKKPHDAIDRHCKKDGVVFHGAWVVTGKKKDGSDAIQKVNKKFIDVQNVSILISKSELITEEEKEEMIKELFGESVVIIHSRKEIEFLSKLEKALQPFDLTIKKQHKMLNFEIDAYIKELKIAIEYDENEHKHYNEVEEKRREREIKEKTGCEFIRVSDYDDDNYNVGLVMKAIFETKLKRGRKAIG